MFDRKKHTVKVLKVSCKDKGVPSSQGFRQDRHRDSDSKPDDTEQMKEKQLISLKEDGTVGDPAVQQAGKLIEVKVSHSGREEVQLIHTNIDNCGEESDSDGTLEHKTSDCIATMADGREELDVDESDDGDADLEDIDEMEDGFTNSWDPVQNHTGKPECPECGRVFSCKATLKRHLAVHSETKAFECKICNKKFQTESGLHSHMLTHGDGRRVVCHLCGKTYSHPSYLAIHLSLHAGVKPFKCDECGREFPYRQSLIEHQRRHKDEKPAACDTCGKTFNNKRQLKVHMRYHASKTEISCQDCKMFFQSQQSLNKHMYKTHQRQYTCDFCGKVFVNKKHLHSHMARDHKQERKMTPENLARSRKTECPKCHQMFYNRYVLRNHLSSKHGLTDEQIKGILHIRKKVPSQREETRRLSSNNSGGKTESKRPRLDNTTFRVFYRDDEMAVYVKGVENVDDKITDITQHQYIVNDLGEEGNLRCIYLDDEGHIANRKENSEEVIADSGQNTQHDEAQVVTAGEENGDGSQTNEQSDKVEQSDDKLEKAGYYVFKFAEDATEASEDNIETETVYQTIDDDGNEQIVLILNEEKKTDDTASSVSQGEIVYENYDDSAYIQTDTISGDNSSSRPSVEIEQSEVVDLCMNQDKFNPGSMQSTHSKTNHTGHFNSKSNSETCELIVSECLESRFPVLKHSHERLNFLSSDKRQNFEVDTNRSVNQISFSRSVDAAAENPQVPDIVDQDVFIDKDKELNINQQLETSVHLAVPKTSSALEFAEFETALKSKVGEFRTAEEFKAYIDKMINSLENVKQTVNVLELTQDHHDQIN